MVKLQPHQQGTLSLPSHGFNRWYLEFIQMHPQDNVFAHECSISLSDPWHAAAGLIFTEHLPLQCVATGPHGRVMTRLVHDGLVLQCTCTDTFCTPLNMNTQKSFELLSC